MRLIGSIFAIAMLAGLPGARAQPNIQISPSGSDNPPVAIGPGWRYERRPSELHMFICLQDSCDRSSRVSYRVYAAVEPITLEKYRQEQERVVKALQERAPPGHVLRY
jgi:hypothetical protein